MTSNERWAEIEGYPGYLISDYGAIKSPRKEAFYGYRDANRPYYYAALCKNNKMKHTMIHRLVAKAFVPNWQNAPLVNHKDGNILNNHYTNLEWCSEIENQRHAIINNHHSHRCGRHANLVDMRDWYEFV